MMLSEAEARRRLRDAVQAAGSQRAFAARLPGLSPAAAESAVSRGLLRPAPIHPVVLRALGLRRAKGGAIHPAAPARLQFLAIHAEGEAAFDAAVALVSAALRPG